MTSSLPASALPANLARPAADPSTETSLETHLRDATADDAVAVAAVYAPHVLHGTATFETDVPSPEEMARRHADVIDRGWPWLVAERDGRVLGYAYANAFRARAAYRWCLEDSIYLAPEACGQGLGKRLLAELLARCEAAGARQMMAVIGDSANAGSIGVHRALGFAPTGTMRSAGWKHGRWIDVVLMQKTLGDGDGSPPGA